MIALPLYLSIYGCIVIAYDCWMIALPLYLSIYGCIVIAYDCWMIALPLYLSIYGCIVIAYDCWMIALPIAGRCDNALLLVPGKRVKYPNIQRSYELKTQRSDPKQWQINHIAEKVDDNKMKCKYPRNFSNYIIKCLYLAKCC